MTDVEVNFQNEGNPSIDGHYGALTSFVFATPYEVARDPTLKNTALKKMLTDALSWSSKLDSRQKLNIWKENKPISDNMYLQISDCLN